MNNNYIFEILVFKEKCFSDILLQFLPCINRNVLWTLKKGPRRAFTTGQLNLCLQLGTKKTADFMLHLYCHITFIRLSYEKKVLKEDVCL